jgi:hypothetical protein
MMRNCASENLEVPGSPAQGRVRPGTTVPNIAAP